MSHTQTKNRDNFIHVPEIHNNSDFSQDKERCLCDWGDDCRRYQAFFAARKAAGEDEPRAGRVIRMTMHENNEKMKAWRKVLVKNIGISKENAARPVWSVAPHHWSVEQLRYFNTNKKPSTPLPIKEMKCLADPFDATHSMQTDSGKRYFHSPNLPKDSIDEIVSPTMGSTGSSARLRRHAARQQSAAFARLHQYKKSFGERSLGDYINGKENTPVNASTRHRPQPLELQSLKRTMEGSLDAVASLQKKRRQSQQLAHVHQKRSASPKFDSSIEDKMEDATKAFLDENASARYQLTSEAWHRKNPRACRDLFGFASYHEMCKYIGVFFTDVPQSIAKICYSNKGNKLIYDPQYPTDFEQVLITKYFMHHISVRKITGLHFGVAMRLQSKDTWINGPRDGGRMVNFFRYSRCQETTSAKKCLMTLSK
jgi:hypothetical protein